MRTALLIFGLTLLVLSACQEGGPVATASEPAQPSDQSVPMPDHHARIITLVETGERALADGDADGLLEVARSLQAMGAVPHSGTEDLAKRWEVQAQELTPEDARETIPYRGRIKGPAYRRQTLSPETDDVIEDVFYAAETAQMTLQVMGSSSLRWEVSEDGADDGPVCTGSVGTDGATCRFMPLWTSKYRIRITNSSDQSATYLFVTN